MIEVKALNKNFGSNRVIKELTVSFEEGDLVLIQGRNGCGKSTFLKILAGLVKPTTGEVIYSKQYDIGALIENPEFLDFKSLEYNLKFLYNLKNNYQETVVRDLCEKFSLDIKNNQHLGKFSVGMRQKAGVIQAIMEHQNLILLDEPTRGMDAESIVEFNGIIQSLIKAGNNIIIVAAHDGVEGLNFNKRVEM